MLNLNEMNCVVAQPVIICHQHRKALLQSKQDACVYVWTWCHYWWDLSQRAHSSVQVRCVEHSVSAVTSAVCGTLSVGCHISCVECLYVMQQSTIVSVDH